MTDQPGPPAGGAPMSERMQALLSRAVEDQVSEQRQIQALLGEIRTMLAQLPAQVAASSAGRPADDSGSEHVRARLDDLAGRITLLSQRIDALASTTESRAQDDTSLLAVVGAVQSATDSLIARLDGLSQRIDEIAARSAEGAAQSAAADDAAPRLAAVEARLGEFTTALAEVSGRMSGLGNVVGTLPEEVRALSERIESRVGNRLDRLDEIAAAVAALQSSFGATSSGGQELVELRNAVQALAERPTPDSRESVALAVQQVLGETVSAKVQESTAQSEQRIIGRVDSAVQESSAQSEQRIIEHVDSAVFTLAEVMLKRRATPSRSGGSEAPAGQTPFQPAANLLPDGPAAPPAREPVVVPKPVEETPSAAREALAELASEDTVEDQPPTEAGAEPAADGEQAAEEGDFGKRRRAWWRPGE